MKTFKSYLNENRMNPELISATWVSILSEDLDNLNESDVKQVATKVTKNIEKAGFKVHKSTGVLEYIFKFLKGSGKLFYYMLKGDYDKAKEILKSVKKEEVLDFLFKLDLGTLHLFTGPIHMIDAWTGWDLSVNLQSSIKKAEELSKDFQQALIVIKDTITNAFSGKPKNNLLKCVNKLEKGVPIKG
jgi:hypothetical protein